jgi:hypothetical protein
MQCNRSKDVAKLGQHKSIPKDSASQCGQLCISLLQSVRTAAHTAHGAAAAGHIMQAQIA